MRRSVVALVAGLGALFSACGSGTSSTSSTSSSTGHVAYSHTVTGVDDLYGISCPTATSCEAVGANALDGQGIVVTVTNGSPGTPHTVSGTKAIRSVSCATPTTCEAVGTGQGHGVVLSVTGGIPSTPEPVGDMSTFEAISCFTASACQAGGRAGTVGAVTSGPPTVSTVAGTTSVNGLACPDSTTCESVASTSNGKLNDVLVPLTGGIPGAFQVVPPGTSTFAGIACVSSSNCVAVGRGIRVANGRNTPEAVVLSVANGKPGKLTSVPSSSAALLQAVACGPSHGCEAVGTDGPLSAEGGATGHGVFLSVTGGVPGTVDSVSGAPLVLNGIACPTANTCEAVGTTGASGPAVVVTLSLS